MVMEPNHPNQVLRIYEKKANLISDSKACINNTYSSGSYAHCIHPGHSNLTMCSALARHLRFCSSHCQFGVARGACRTVVYTRVGLSMLWPGCLSVASMPVGLLKPLLVQGSCGGRTCGCTKRCGGCWMGGLEGSGMSKGLSFCSPSQP